MSLPYILRLICICFAAFFLIHEAIAAGLSAAAPAVVRFARGMKPRSAARFLFGVRMLAAGAAGFVVLGLCVPSYIRLELRVGVEQVGWLCIALALLGALICWRAGWRMANAGFASQRFGRVCARNGRAAKIGGEWDSATILELKVPLLAVVGIVRRKLVISTDVLQALSEGELDVALRHERVHRIRHDNFKRLLFLAAPRGFFFSRGLDAIERQWSKISEWAADDHAAQGDSQRALSLASALVRIARMGSAPPEGVILSPFVEGENLSERVERLLQVAPEPERTSSKMSAMVAGAAAMGVCLITALMMNPRTLTVVHALLERLID